MEHPQLQAERRPCGGVPADKVDSRICFRSKCSLIHLSSSSLSLLVVHPNSFSPARQRFGDYKYIRHPVADIYRIHLFGMSRFIRNMGFLYQLFVRFVYTDNWVQRIIRTLVNLQHILHFRHKISISLWNAPFLYKPRLDFVFFITSQMVLSVM